MNSKDYWAQREAEALKHRITDEREYDKEIKRIYSEMLDNIQKEIDGFYGRYAAKEGISLAEAKKRVSKLDIERYERKAEKYVREKDFSDKANEEMRIYNLTMKVNRLELLKAQIGLETIAGHDALQKYLETILKGRTLDELKRQAGILGKSLGNNAKAAHAIVNGSFHNGTFSDRIWQYQDLMRIELGKQLQIGLIQGKNPRAIARSLEKFWYGNDPLTGGGAVYCMERLMRTELARVQTEAQKQSFNRNGFDMFMFIANSGCCPDCQRLNGKTFRVSKMMPGENAAPLHPNCRCSVAAHEDSAEYEAWLDYLSKGGTTAEWNRMKADKNTLDDIDEFLKAQKAYEESFGKLNDLEKEVDELLDRYMDALGTKNEKRLEKLHGQKYDEFEKFKEVVKDLKARLAGKEAKAVRQVEKNLARAIGISSDKIKMTGLPYDSASMIYKAYRKTLNLYPELRGKLDGFEYDEKPDKKSYASCSAMSGKITAYQIFSDSKRLAKRYTQDVEDGFHPKGTDYKSIIVHELGHALDGYMTKNGILDGKVGKYGITRSSSKVQHRVLDSLGWYDEITRIKDDMRGKGAKHSEIMDEIEKQRKEFIKTKLSEYASENEKEFFAECFAEYVMSDNPREAAQTFGQIIDKELGR